MTTTLLQPAALKVAGTLNSLHHDLLTTHLKASGYWASEAKLGDLRWDHQVAIKEKLFGHGDEERITTLEDQLMWLESRASLLHRESELAAFSDLAAHLPEMISQWEEAGLVVTTDLDDPDLMWVDGIEIRWSPYTGAWICG